MIPISTAVKVRGDNWTLNLDVHDPRGGRTVLQDDPQRGEWRSAFLYRSARKRGLFIAQAALFVARVAGA